MMNKNYCIIVLIICLVLSLLFFILDSNPKIPWDKQIKSDYQKYHDVFNSLLELMPQDKYYKISARDYDKNNDALKFVFEELGYTEIYTDFKGNVFFNRFSEGITFRGLVYLANKNYVVGIPESETIYISQDEKWIAYYFCSL